VSNQFLQYRSAGKARPRPKLINVLIILFFLSPSILAALALLIMFAIHYR
jgi:hypothetical protein